MATGMTTGRMSEVTVTGKIVVVEKAAVVTTIMIAVLVVALDEAVAVVVAEVVAVVVAEVVVVAAVIDAGIDNTFKLMIIPFVSYACP